MGTTRLPEARLSSSTRERARRALDGEGGRGLVDLRIDLEDHPDLLELPPELQYAHCVRLIAEQAPLRLLEGERLVGSATLALAPRHCTPVYRGEKPAFAGTSHVTLGFDHALRVGYRGLREEIEERKRRGGLDRKGEELLEAMLICLQAAGRWHQRYLDLLEERSKAGSPEEEAHWRAVRENLAPVPEAPPENFHQALQALWFLFAFQRLCGNWPGLGRLDEMLGPYLERDLAAGIISRDTARELVADFWIKGCEWIGAETCFSGPEGAGGSGDAQHYQNVVLGGVDAEGREVTNEVTYLILDVVEETGISDFPVAVRLSAQTPERLLRRIAEVQRRGGGIVSVYNEDTVIEGLVRGGYPEREARRFANDGCWEAQIPGETCFVYHSFDMLALLQETLGVIGEGPVAEQADFESLYSAFRERLAVQVERLQEQADRFALGGPPATLISLLERDCIERGRGYHDRGARYNVFSPHAGGLPDTANSLLAIRWLVYEQGLLSLRELVEVLRRDWEGEEALRQRVQGELEYYGNDAPAADAMTKRVFDDFLELVGQVRERAGVLRPPGVSTFGREVGWREERGATAEGHKRGAILATNFSPSPGTDRQGPTAVIKSHCAMDLARLPNGTALELKLVPLSLRGERGVQALVGLLKTFRELGGFYLQVDAVSRETLREAQRHPERYAHLAVRISGWSARFVTLSAEWQEMIINRTEQEQL